MLLTRKHFNDAVQVARKSTRMETLKIYDDFRAKYDPQFLKQKLSATTTGQRTYDWGAVAFKNNEGELNDDDIY